MNKDSAHAYIQSHNLIGIKAGAERPDFLEIWMVIVRNRIFARSWGLAERSWYTAFLKNPEGQIRCGEETCNIQAMIPEDIDELAAEINQAYMTKYNSERNRKYVEGIIKGKHIQKTMEFVICDER